MPALVMYESEYTTNFFIKKAASTNCVEAAGETKNQKSVLVVADATTLFEDGCSELQNDTPPLIGVARPGIGAIQGSRLTTGLGDLHVDLFVIVRFSDALRLSGGCVDVEMERARVCDISVSGQRVSVRIPRKVARWRVRRLAALRRNRNRLRSVLRTRQTADGVVREDTVEELRGRLTERRPVEYCRQRRRPDHRTNRVGVGRVRNG